MILLHFNTHRIWSEDTHAGKQTEAHSTERHGTTRISPSVAFAMKSSPSSFPSSSLLLRLLALLRIEYESWLCLLLVSPSSQTHRQQHSMRLRCFDSASVFVNNNTNERTHAHACMHALRTSKCTAPLCWPIVEFIFHSNVLGYVCWR